MPPPFLRAPRWTPPSIVGAASLLLLLSLTLQGISRGTDYITGQDLARAGGVLDVAEQTLPLPAWGSVYVAGGVLILAGIFASYSTRLPLAQVSTQTVLCGHVVSFAANVGVSAAMLWPVLVRGLTTHEWSGWRTGTGLVVAAIFHATWAVLAAARLRGRRAQL